ncbi:predicted protein [Botrytis cinerea T4]|uniref:Uncharacterized protein n=1 Tax=Botryotinia fuckeliana (strain T4) TaxID=999810 RepID=G2Y6B3_BOTF4|nr:predicted protein [Botrytis cinerea T4]
MNILKWETDGRASATMSPRSPNYVTVSPGLGHYL